MNEVSQTLTGGNTNVRNQSSTNNYLGYNPLVPGIYFNMPLHYLYYMPIEISNADRIILESTVPTWYNSNMICYSMRLVIYSYTGPIINLTRSSDNTSSNFYTNRSQSYFTTGYNNTGMSYITWIGASTTVYVNIWYDQSGKGNHAIQNTAINRPRIITQNSKYVINFLNSGSDVNYLNLTTPIQPNTIFTHFYPKSQFVNTIVQTNADYSFRIYQTPTSVFSENSGDLYYTSSVNNGGTQVSYVNNVSSTTNITLDAWDVISLSIQKPWWDNLSFQKIAYDINAGRALNGYMTEIIFHNTTMTATDMQDYYTNRLF